MATLTQTSVRGSGMTSEEKFVIFASSLGTVFEWYDFYLYAVLAPFFSAVFFPPGNNTAALLSAFATYAAGFLVRPFGALIFGRVGDLVGRKYTFLVTIVVMGASTFLVGLLPTFAQIGWIAPILLVTLRLCQGLALGGEYGGAATYVAEHSRPYERGYSTSFIQTTATLGFFLALIVIGLCRVYMDTKMFAEWGWRIPFLVSLILLVFSVYIRLKLNETPIFQRMKEEGKGSKAPLTESFFRYPNNKYVLLALLGATAGQGVVWYTGQFYALFFLTITLKLAFIPTYVLIGLSLVIGTPFFIVFGWLSDRIGRLKIILAGCAIAAVTYFPLFGLDALRQSRHRSIPGKESGDGLRRSIHLPLPCVRGSVVDVLELRPRPGTRHQARHVFQDAERAGQRRQDRSDGRLEPGRRVGCSEWQAAFTAAGHRATADLNKVNWFMAELILVIMVIYVTMVYGPIAAFLVEMSPQDPLHLHVAALSHRQRLVRRNATASRHCRGRRHRQHLCRAVVSDRCRGDDGLRRTVLPARHARVDIVSGSGVAIQRA